MPAAAETVTLADDGTLGARLRALLMDAPARMQAILTQFKHPLKRVLALRVGDVLAINPKLSDADAA